MKSTEQKIFDPMIPEQPETPLSPDADGYDSVSDPEAVFSSGIRNHHIAITAYPIAQ